jgi:hypothetical protein
MKGLLQIENKSQLSLTGFVQSLDFKNGVTIGACHSSFLDANDPIAKVKKSFVATKDIFCAKAVFLLSSKERLLNRFQLFQFLPFRLPLL